jgi:hypothetical protein
MAITTVDGIVAGFQKPHFFFKGISPTLVAGRPHSFWANAGIPGAGAFDTTLNGVVLSSSSAMVNGQIPHTDPGSGNAYLARFVAGTSIAGKLLLCDRLWHNGGYTITSTSAQNSTTPTWPARDEDGSTNGKGVLLGVEVSVATGAGTPTLTVAYTNSAGTASRSATNTFATVASSAAGAFYPIGLQAGDLGVRSVQSLTLSLSWTSGTINMVAYRVLADLDLPGAFIGQSIDALTGGLPQLYNGTVPFLIFIPNTTTASYCAGQYIETQG